MIKRIFCFCITTAILSFSSPVPTTADLPEPVVYEVVETNATVEKQISLGICKVTAYCKENYPHICNDGNSSVTSTGTTPTAGRTVAVDPRVIPYGSEVIISGHTYIAEDCGGAIKGNRVDICFDTHKQALNFGIQYLDVVYVIKEDKQMCQVCMQYPCHPRCPNAVQHIVCYCEICDSEIYDGDEMYNIDGTKICERCVSDSKTTAIYEDDNYYD